MDAMELIKCCQQCEALRWRIKNVSPDERPHKTPKSAGILKLRCLEREQDAALE